MSEIIIPAPIIQLNTVVVPSGPNNGDYVLHTALDSNGGVWQLYQSHGYSNVPEHGKWIQVELNALSSSETCTMTEEEQQKAMDQVLADAHEDCLIFGPEDFH